MPDEHRYTEDEVEQIIRRALKRKAPKDAISRKELLETGRELGIGLAFHFKETYFPTPTKQQDFTERPH